MRFDKNLSGDISLLKQNFDKIHINHLNLNDGALFGVIVNEIGN